MFPKTPPLFVLRGNVIALLLARRPPPRWPPLFPKTTAAFTTRRPFARSPFLPRASPTWTRDIGVDALLRMMMMRPPIVFALFKYSDFWMSFRTCRRNSTKRRRTTVVSLEAERDEERLGKEKKRQSLLSSFFSVVVPSSSVVAKNVSQKRWWFGWKVTNNSQGGGGPLPKTERKKKWM